MTKLVIETDDNWTREKIRDSINNEINLLKKAAEKIQNRLKDYEKKYGKLDDMELIEWEGEIDTLGKLQTKMNSLS